MKLNLIFLWQSKVLNITYYNYINTNINIYSHPKIKQKLAKSVQTIFFFSDTNDQQLIFIQIM